MKTIRLIPILLAASIMAAAQDVSGPVSGFVFDAGARALRPMLGIPGAGFIGDPVLSGLDFASIAPDGNSALIVQAGRLFRAAPLKGAVPAQIAVDRAISNAGLIAWSGDSAAVYSPSTGKAQIVRDLSKTPAATDPVDLTDLSGSVSALALSGDDLFLGVSGAIYRVSADGTRQLLARAQTPSAIVLAGQDLYFADRDSGEVWTVANVADPSTPVRFAGGIDSPVAIRIVGSRLLVAGAGGNKLGIYDLKTRAATGTLDLAFTPSSLDSMGSSLLLLAPGSDAGQPYYIVEISQDPAVFFVPVGGAQQ